MVESEAAYTVLNMIKDWEKERPNEHLSTQAIAFKIWNMGYKRVTATLAQLKETGHIEYGKDGWRSVVDQAQVDTVEE